MSNLKFDDIVEVNISSAGAIAPRDGFNVGLIVGKTVGTGMSGDNRCIVVTSLAELVDAGFAANTNEYKAATKYFGQTPAPAKLVVGLCVGTTEGNTTTYESWVDCITACRAANHEWYGVCVADTLTSAEIQAIGAYVETIIASFFYEDSTAADKTSATTDVFSAMKGLNYRRSFGIYSTSQFAAAAAMGLAMGMNDGTANSAGTMAYKKLTGIVTDDLSAAEVGFLQGKNANYYVTRGGTYDLLEKGVCADGSWYDEVLGLDQLAYEIQRNCMDILSTSRTKVPYTDAGVKQFVVAVNEACNGAVERGFLTPGIWRGAATLDLENGDALPAGYLTQAVSVNDRPLTEKQLRICPPIYVCAILAGAIHSVKIKVNVM